MSFPQTMSLSCIFVVAPSFIRMDLSIVSTSTSLTFSEFLVLFSSIALLFSFICQVSPLTSSCQFSMFYQFSASSSFLELHLTSFHQASLSFLRVHLCSSSGLHLIGPKASHFATIRRWGNTQLNLALQHSLSGLAILHGPTTQHCLCEAKKPLLHSWYHFYSQSTTCNITFLVMTSTLTLHTTFSYEHHWLSSCFQISISC